MPESWNEFIEIESSQKYFIDLQLFLEKQYQERNIYPEQKQIFFAFEQTPLQKIKVVILGQDPYHGAGQAHGLAFSVQPGIKKPPSLKNIFKEIEQDLSVAMPSSGTLTGWARQGVLLLNTVLTVAEGQAGAHTAKGWETFTDKAITVINDVKNPVVFLLWGNHSQKKESLITNPQHLVLTAAHPSPLSAHRGFLGCRHFSKTNAFLKEKGLQEIDWTLVESFY